MKSIFRNLKSLALVALVGFAAFAVSCEPTVEPKPEPTPGETVNEAYEFVDGNALFFEAGEKKTVAVKEGQTLEGATIVASPEGWDVAVVGNNLEITAPTQESVDGEGAEAYGDVELKLEGEETIYEGKLSVYMGKLVVVEQISNSFKDIEVKAVIAGIDNYLVHLGTNGEWQSSFDEWKNTQDSWNPIEFGWDGEYFGAFEGSLFTFADNPYKSNYQPIPGTKYQLAILPLVEDKAAVNYTYDDIYLFDFETVAAGDNGSVVPQFTLESKSHTQVAVSVDATGAYMTYYAFYSQRDIDQIGENNLEKVLKNDLIKKGVYSTEDTFVAKEDGLEENETTYLAAISIDESGNFGAMAFEQFTTDVFQFNEDVTITLGEITCSSDGKTVYIPVESVEGCDEVAQYRYFYVNDNNSSWWLNLSSSPEKAELLMATVVNEYYGPKFMDPATLAANNNVITVTGGPYPGTMGHVFVMVIDQDGMPSRAAYTTYIPSDTSVPMIAKGEEGYEYGMPTISYKGVTEGMKGDVVIYTVDFNVHLVDGTDTAWVALAGADYVNSYTPYTLLMSMVSGDFMYSTAYTTDGVFNGDILYAQNDADGVNAVYVSWLDDNGNYHETALMLEPVEDAQDDVKEALKKMNQ